MRGLVMITSLEMSTTAPLMCAFARSTELSHVAYLAIIPLCILIKFVKFLSKKLLVLSLKMGTCCHKRLELTKLGLGHFSHCCKFGSSRQRLSSCHFLLRKNHKERTPHLFHTPVSKNEI